MSGLEIPRVFSDEKVGPYTEIDWENRTAEIKAADGSTVFRQENVNVPKPWSQLATNIVASKYFYGEQGTPERETSVATLISRVANTITNWGKQDGYFASDKDSDCFYNELTWLCLNQYGSFNSPVWFNVGVREKPQTSACFLQSVDDNMESIMDLAKSEAMLFKYGSGTGTDLTPLRSSKEKLTGGGKPSGPVSFMKLYDTIGGIIKSGGKTRRAARLNCLQVTHPDIMEFIECKVKEERKAKALIEFGYDADFNGEAYSTVAFQNTNISVRVTDEFMKAVEEDLPWELYGVDGKRHDWLLDADNVLTSMAESAWECGDPGIQYHDTLNAWHTCPNTAAQSSSNPCFPGNTLVDTSEGRIKIKDLARMRQEGLGLPMVFSFDLKSGFPVLRKIADAWCSKKTKYFAKVTTQKGLVVECTPDHKFLTYKGSYVAARDLKSGERLRKIGRAINTNRSNRFCINHKTTKAAPNGTVWQNRFMWEQAYGPIPYDMEVHHKNDDQTDDRLSNLELVPCGTHQKFHSTGLRNGNAMDVDDLLLLETWEAIEYAKAGKSGIHSNIEVTPSKWNSYIRKNDLQGKVPFAGSPTHGGRIRGKTWWEFSRWIDEQQLLANDRVESVELFCKEEEEDVFDLMVEGTGNFAITTEDSVHSIIVKNCGEFVFLPDTACNLASLNLMKFRKEDGSFDVDRFRAAVRIFIIAMDILIDRSSYPTEKIAQNSRDFRPLGLGYANLGAYVMSLGFPYDSDEARDFAAAITAIMHSTAYEASSEIARVKGPFNGFELNHEPMLNVINKHYEASISQGDKERDPQSDKLWFHAISGMIGCKDCGQSHGFRNAQVTVLAPCGTIGFMMDCDTTGIEPELALVKHKSLAGGGSLKLVNQTVAMALERLGYDKARANRIVEYIAGEHGANSPPGLLEKDKAVFDCSFPGINGRSIAPSGHIKMMAAVQPFLSGAISKTVNMPYDSTVEDIKEAYMEGWRLGLKSLSIYRDGSKGSQPLNIKKDKTKNVGHIDVLPFDGDNPSEPVPPVRSRLPMTRKSITHKFDIQGHEGYIHVGMYDDGRPGEMFITMAKQGSTVSGLMDALATSVSISLQYGIPLSILSEKLKHTRYEPCGFTKNKEIPITSSICDYVFRWMEQQFEKKVADDDVLNSLLECPEMVLASYPISDQFPVIKIAGGAPIPNFPNVDSNIYGISSRSILDNLQSFQTDSPLCDVCGSLTERNGTCYRCRNCGNSMGCS